MKKTIVLLSLLFFGTATMAQLSIHADISPRAELRHGYRVMLNEDEKAAGHINQRTRLALAFEKDNIKTHISFQDVRVWGQEPQRQVHPSLGIHEAWAELTLQENWAVKVGRQHLRYDNQRFFAINDWLPMGQKHDVVLLKHQHASGEAHLGTAFNQPWAAYPANFGTVYGINNYKYMNFLRYTTTLGDDGNLALMAVADGYESTFNPNTLYVRGTWSAFVRYQLGNINLMINPAFQHGNTRWGQDISAGYLRTEASLPLSETITTTTGIEIFSGNDATNANDDKYRAFDALYGAGHANLGFMDYFTQIPQHTREAGMINPFIKNRIRLNPRTFMDADLHLFFLQNNYVHNNEVINKYLGTEIDLTLNYGFNEFTRIIGGFSMMFGSESMEIIKRGSKDEPAYFAYIMLRIRPKLL